VKLADFILGNMEPILVEWESFAATRTPAASTMTPLALRDHAEEILLAITRDLASAQTPLQQHQKSLGNGLAEKSHAAETAAQTHATLRSRSGFDINQLAAEYRALRASVLRQWLEASAGAHCDLDDMVRFNEAIDQALAESIAFFSAEVDRARNLLLGMLGHDMRTPLQTIIATAAYLAELNAGAQVSDASCRLITSGARMKALLDDLVDFNRTNLGLGIPVAMEPGDLAAAFSAELDLLRGAHPRRRIDLTIEGDAHGCWDTLRMRQLLCNLVTNAIKYGDSDAPVQVHLIGEACGSRSGTAACWKLPSTRCSNRFGVVWCNAARGIRRASASGCTSHAKSPRRTAATSNAGPAIRKRSSACGCRVPGSAPTPGRPRPPSFGGSRRVRRLPAAAPAAFGRLELQVLRTHRIAGFGNAADKFGAVQPGGDAQHAGARVEIGEDRGIDRGEGAFQRRYVRAAARHVDEVLHDGFSRGVDAARRR
jgi:signal transduction histidine kinase